MANVEVTGNCDIVADWARNVVAHKGEWLIMDTETTGVETTDECVQIGILDLDGNVVFDAILKPEMPMSKTSIEKTGLTQEMLDEAPTYPTVHEDLRKVLKGKKILTYNVDFDRKLLNQTAARYRLVPPAVAGWECVMLKYSAFCGEWWKSKKDYKWQPLPFSKHEAIEDCFAVLDLLRRLASYYRVNRKGWIWCNTSDYCCSLDFEDGRITGAAPIMRWAIGKPVDLVYSKIKLSLIAWIAYEGERCSTDASNVAGNGRCIPAPVRTLTQSQAEVFVKVV
jgi:DNA polymerase III subunit epsilon